MRFFFLLLCGLHVGCAHRYVLTPVHQSECDCERLRLVGDTLVCSTADSSLKFSMDSVSKIERRPRLGGTLAIGGVGAYFGALGGTIIGALFAWSSSTKTPEPYIFIPMLLGSLVGFFAGKSLWAILDTKTLYPMSLPAGKRQKAIQTFVE
ncbi:MAG: hypothetical protein SNJ55_03245 [Chloroherpetonaceae bacterium]